MGAGLFWGACLGLKPDISPFAQRPGGNRKEEKVEPRGSAAGRSRTEIPPVQQSCDGPKDQLLPLPSRGQGLAKVTWEQTQR